MYFPKIKDKNQLNSLVLNTKRVILALLVLLISTNPVFAMTQQEAQDQINQLNKQNQDAQAQVSQLQGQSRSLANDIAIFDAQANQLQIQINQAQAEIDLTNAEIDTTNAQIAQAEIDLQKQKEMIKEYLRVMYMEGQKSTFEIVATSNTFSDFMDKSQYISTMQEHIQDTANKIVALKAELDQKKHDLEVKKAKAEELKSQVLSQQSQINIQRAQKDALLQQTKGSEKNYQTIISSNNARMGILHCIATGGCQSVANGDLVATNTPLYYSQIDSAWKNYQYDGPGNTIGNYGCLITSLAMYHGISPTAEAGRHSYWDGYMLGGFGQNVTGNWAEINNALLSGHPVIFGLYLNSYGDTHFVLAKSTSGGKYYINDPYFTAGHAYYASQVFQAVIPY